MTGEPFRQHDQNQATMYLLDTNEFITFDSDVSDETGKVMAPRRGTIEETFLWLPVYRSPCFPVFFYAGNRRYNRNLSRYPKDVSHTVDPRIVALAKALHCLGDELREEDSLQRACDVQFLSISPQPISLSNLVMYPKILIACVARRFLRRLKRFTRGRGSDRNALEKMEQLVMPEQKLAEYSLPGKSHLQISSDPGQSTRGSSCLSYSLSASGDESDAQVEMEASLKAMNYSVTNTQPTCCPLQMSSDPGWSRRGSSCLLRSLSVPSLSQVTSAKNKTFTRAKSLPDLLLENSFEQFTPDITVDENDEAYWLRCSCPGLYQCRVTGLVFHMEGEGDVVYRIVPWNRRLLAQHHKQPAGPLFDIKCLQQSVCQLHLPHCEICFTGGCDFLSVAHVNDEGIEFIAPHKITESHVVINITGFSAFGNVKDVDSPPDPVRALVLLFYRPPADPDPTSLLNVLLLPRNVVLRDVLRTRKKLVGDESYIETSPHCKLHPKQEYTLSTCPEDDSVVIQPKDAEFDCDNYDNYFPSFQVSLENILKHLKLLLRDTNKHSVWERQICLSSTGVKRSCGPSILNLPSREKLFDIRSSFIDGISGPVLKSLLDKLFDKKVMTDSERESADEMQNKRDKARFVIDTVRMKGEAASSEMIEFLCETDPFLCEHLGLV